jgi:hypothetical protein
LKFVHITYKNKKPGQYLFQTFYFADLSLLCSGETLLETIYTTGRVQDLLLSCEEWVRCGRDFDTNYKSMKFAAASWKTTFLVFGCKSFFILVSILAQKVFLGNKKPALAHGLWL